MFPRAIGTRASFGLLFDLDGTLAHTDHIHERAWREVLAGYGVVLDSQDYLERIRGRANPAIVASLLPDLDAVEAERVARDKEASFRERARSLVPTHGVVELLDRAVSAGWGLAVVTNAPRKNAEHTLSVLGVREAFVVVVAADDVKRPKPAPDPFRRALQLLELAPEQALAFEDSPSGVRAATAAQLPVAGLLTGHARDELLEAGARIVAEDFAAEVMLGWIEAAAAGRGSD
jgi:phosphoglycolate phosphatase